MAWRRRPEARGALALLALALCAPGARGRAHEWFSAVVSTEYVDPQTNRSVRSVSESGRFGDSSPKEGARGLVGASRSSAGTPRGGGDGLRTSGPARVAPAWLDVTPGSLRREPSLRTELHLPVEVKGTGNIVVIMVSYPKGREIVELVQKDIPVTVTIGVGTRHVQEFISAQSVVFVAIAFITMMIISLAWLIFYYIQRFLYTGSQFGSQSHRKETKKVIGQLPVHTVKHGEKGIDVDAESCAVCIENFKGRDVIRILPCKHIFHRICIDPWLLDHRTCPMCKLDVIKALGYWGELEDVQEVTAPESPPGGVSAADLSLTVPDGERSDAGSSESPSTSDPVPPCGASFKEDAGENTALLETGRSDAQCDGPAC
nr:PREDICTED: E3 ubiquitin-protein ligase RNF149 [Bos indicus]